MRRNFTPFWTFSLQPVRALINALLLQSPPASASPYLTDGFLLLQGQNVLVPYQGGGEGAVTQVQAMKGVQSVAI